MKLYADVSCPKCRARHRIEWNIDGKQIWEIITAIGVKKIKCTCGKEFKVELDAEISE